MSNRTRRPIHYFFVLLGLLCLLNLYLFFISSSRHGALAENSRLFDVVTSGLGLTDLCIATEARYTRHPAISDPVVPFMDHPGAIEHFPTGSFWTPPPQFSSRRGT